MSGSGLKALKVMWFGLAVIAVMVAVLGALAYAEPLTKVVYQLYRWEGGIWREYCPDDPFPAGGDQPGTNLWKYTYVVHNLSAPQALRDIYTFFNSDNVAMDATWAGAAAPTGWTATQIGPFAPDFNWKERFRTANSIYYIQAGQSLAGFAVEFTWTKHQLPGAQTYDAVFSGGSESDFTESPCGPVATEANTWGGIKALYR